MADKFNTTIAFRTTAYQKQAFILACADDVTQPSKYKAGNILRQFIRCYADNPSQFDVIFARYAQLND